MTLTEWMVSLARKMLERGEQLSNTMVRELTGLGVDVVALEKEYAK